MMVPQKVEKPVKATPDLIREKQFPPWELADSWILLLRLALYNDRVGEFLRPHRKRSLKKT
jgi:hypothetical protein